MVTAIVAIVDTAVTAVAMVMVADMDMDYTPIIIRIMV